jgi:hypothetical protein
MTVNRYLTKRSVFCLVTSAAVLVCGVTFPLGTAQAGVIPWMYDAIFGPVGSMGMGRAYAGYGGYGIGSYYSGYSPVISSGYAPASPYIGSYGNAGAGCSSCQSSMYAPSFSGYSTGYGMTDGFGSYGSYSAPVMGDGFCNSGCGTPGSPCSINAAPFGTVTPSPDPGPSRTRNRDDNSRPIETRDMRPVTPPRANDNFREPLETDGFRSRSAPNRAPSTFDDEAPGTGRSPARTPGSSRDPVTPGSGSGRGTGTGTGFPDDPDFGDSAPVRKPVTPRNPVETNKPVIEDGNGQPQSNSDSPRMPAPTNDEDVREGRKLKSAIAYGKATPLGLDDQRTGQSPASTFDRLALSAKFAAPKLVRVQSKPEVWADAPVPTKLARQ